MESLKINPNFEHSKEKIKETIDKAKSENYIPYDKINELKFSCQSCGNCCKYFDVNITDYDIARILENRPDLKIDDFIEVVKPRVKSEVENLKLADDKIAMIILKQKENSKECVFLTKDNKCSIHEFKPIGCRTWPFTLNIYNGDVKWNNLFRPFLKNKCAHKLEDNSNDENFVRENIEKLIDNLNTYKIKVREWNKKNSDYLTKENLFKYIVPNKKDLSLYNELLDTFKGFQEVKLIIESPFYSIHSFDFKEGYKFIEIISDSKGITKLNNIDNLIKIREATNSDFIYYSKFPIDSFKFYRNGSIVYTFFSKIEDFELYENSSIIYKNTEKTFEKRSYEFLFNREIEKFKNIFEVKKNEALNLINIGNFEKSNEVLISIVWKIIIPLLYLLNEKTFYPDTISTLKKSTNNLPIFINEFDKYKKDELNQKRLYFTTKNIVEELFNFVN
ncbi:MAG: hypothetical protein KatS3mg068_1990 [Candidatus Sericytochromatia bacterium]|nr:MAG: hypothetical protein KatS3mg068_1990 [Candidatus Sericytochromatia bacterium]